MSTLPTRLAIAATAAVSRTSSFATSDTPSLASTARPFSSMSVANTVAPSRAKAIAEARPIPAAPAVTNARLPFRRSDMAFSPKLSIVISGHTRARPAYPSSLKKDGLPGQARQRQLRFSLMIVPGHADRAGDVVIAGREFHAGAGGLLADGGAVEFLPRRLVGRIGEAALGFQFGAPPLQFLIGNQDVGAAFIQVDANLVAGLEDGEPAVGRSFRRGVEDRRRARGAGLAAVADAGEGQDAAFDQRRRRLHVHDLRAAGIADRAGATHEQDAALVDVERGIVDAMMIVLRPLEHDRAPLEGVGILGIDQIAVAEFLRNHAGLHDRGIEE